MLFDTTISRPYSLENKHTFTRIAGSNPVPSASFKAKSDVVDALAKPAKSLLTPTVTPTEAKFPFTERFRELFNRT